MRVLITGGAGFVGSSLAVRFRRDWPDATVICMDNLYRPGSEHNRDRLIRQGALFIQSDVRDRRSFDIPPCDLLVDAAAEPSVLAGRSGDVSYVVDTNLGGTLNALEAARLWGAALLFLSTSRVYPVEQLRRIALEERESRFAVAPVQTLAGVSLDGIAEDFPLVGSRTLYGATKYASEVMVGEYAAQFGMRVLVDRCGVIAGPWQMGKVDQGVFALWVASHHYGTGLTCVGYGGRQVRDVVHVEDLADLVLAQARELDRWKGQVYNVGGGTAVSFSLLELTAICREVTGREVAMASDPAVRWGDVPLYVSDARRVARDWGWAPRRDVRRIATDVRDWLCEQGERLRPVFCPGHATQG